LPRNGKILVPENGFGARKTKKIESNLVFRDFQDIGRLN